MGIHLCRRSHLLVLVLCISLITVSARTCSDNVVGDEDAPAYDFISALNFDDHNIKRGIRAETGSSPRQKAYRISRRTDADLLTVSTSQVFPDGFPAQFSFISTYKMASKTRSETWDLVDVQDNRGETQFAIRLYGKGREIQVIYSNNYGKISVAKFNKKDVRNAFQKKWHKLIIGFTGKKITLVLDCEHTFVSALDSTMGSIDNTGNIVIGQAQKTRTVMFDLQWMVIHCDYTKPSRATCNELNPVNFWDGYQADKVQ